MKDHEREERERRGEPTQQNASEQSVCSLQLPSLLFCPKSFSSRNTVFYFLQDARNEKRRKMRENRVFLSVSLLNASRVVPSIRYKGFRSARADPGVREKVA